MPDLKTKGMTEILFYLFAVLTVVPALLMVVARNPVNGAMCMIVSFVGMAALLVFLEAFFLAILQVLVYAGAIMVLFLFIIMLLDLDEVEKLRPKTVTTVASVVGGGSPSVRDRVPASNRRNRRGNPRGRGTGPRLSERGQSFGIRQKNQSVWVRSVYEIHASVSADGASSPRRDDRCHRVEQKTRIRGSFLLIQSPIFFLP